VSLLRELIESSYGQTGRGAADVPMRVSSPPELVVRASTGAPRAR
jgi:hypothetical protein